MSGVRACSALVLCLLVALPVFAGRPSVLVNPNVKGNGTAQTITEGIAMVDPGGKVMVLPGTYAEALVIDKGLTLEALGGESGDVVVAPAPVPTSTAITIATNDPVVIRGVHIEHSGLHGIGGLGPVDVTVENSEIVGALGSGGRAVIIQNNFLQTGGRATLVVRNTFIDLLQTHATPDGAPQFQNFGISPIGDVDSLIEGNVIRRTGGACIFVQTLSTLTGETNADIIGNDLDQCFPLGRAGSLLVGPAGQIRPTAPVPATGTVNIIGNLIQNTTGSCRAAAGINYEMYTGVIEHNVISSVVPPCALPGGRNLRAGIWIGQLRSHRGAIGLPPATPVVRFNDISGNAYAGLQVSPDQSVPVDASCNWWGDASGPGGVGPGSGDAVLGAAMFAPWATAQVAGTGGSCP